MVILLFVCFVVRLVVLFNWSFGWLVILILNLQALEDRPGWQHSRTPDSKHASPQHILRCHDAFVASRSWRMRIRDGGDPLLPAGDAAVGARTSVQSVPDACESLHHVRVAFPSQEMPVCVGCVLSSPYLPLSLWLSLSCILFYFDKTQYDSFH